MQEQYASKTNKKIREGATPGQTAAKRKHSKTGEALTNVTLSWIGLGTLGDDWNKREKKKHQSFGTAHSQTSHTSCTGQLMTSKNLPSLEYLRVDSYVQEEVDKRCRHYKEFHTDRSSKLYLEGISWGTIG